MLQALQAQPQPADEQPELCFEPPPERDFHPLDFNDPRAAYAAKNNLELMRTMAVLTSCQIKPLVSAFVVQVLGEHVVAQTLHICI